ncbi:MAG: PEP-CTERM sorting domain-containing protein [Aquabacterium sp.]|uniref:PEP-CTERM sorting domain-containing protein n=1 Tax=Aquabacterium sp. TaxID=1872578 RepID=UPI003BAF2B0E
MIRFSTVALACVFAFANSSAMAASQASATIGNLSFTLVDLDPFDNLTPSLSFLTSNGSTALSVSAGDTVLGESEAASRTRAGTFSFSKEFLAELTNASATATVGSTQLSAQGVANGQGTSFNAGASTGGISSYYSNGPLTISISANTALLIKADVSLSAAASNATCNPYYYYCGVSDQATATGSISLAYNYVGDGASVSYNQTISKSITATATTGYTTGNWVYDPYYGSYQYVYTTTPGTDEVKSLTDVLTGKFVNMSSSTQFASLGLSVSVNGNATTAAVPEAGALGMAAAGLVVAGALANRSVTAVPEADSSLMTLAGLGIIVGLMRRRRSI